MGGSGLWRNGSRPGAAMSAGFAVIGLVVFLVSGGIFWIVLAAVAAVTAAVLELRLRQARRTGPSETARTGEAPDNHDDGSTDDEDRLTGRVIGPFTSQYRTGQRIDGGWRWTGGAQLPGSLNATAPLACLELVPPMVSIRIHGGRLLGAPPLTVPSGPGVRCYPVLGKFLGTEGVAVEPVRGVAGYFWTAHTEEVLDALEWGGFEVSREERYLPGALSR